MTVWSPSSGRVTRAFGLTSERMHLQLVSPFCRTIGMELMQCGLGSAVCRMSVNRRNMLAGDSEYLHPLALPGLIDHGFSNALMSCIPPEPGILTCDLRIGFAAEPALSDELTLEAEVAILGVRSATVHGIVKNLGGKIVATATGLFRIGTYAGGAELDHSLSGRFDPGPLSGPMCETLGLEGPSESPFLNAGNPAIIGWESGGVLHGGAIAALLMAACQGRAASDENGKAQLMESIDFRFLRPCFTSNKLLSSSRFVRAGRAASFISATCHHSADKPVAEAIATFVT